MANLDRIKDDLRAIAQRRKAVDFSEIRRIADQLELVGYKVYYREARETWIFRIEGQQFTVCDHHQGSRYVKKCYVDAFLEAMANLGLCEE